MASLHFEKEKRAFENYYDNEKKHLTSAVRFYSNIVRSLLKKSDVVVKKIEGRVKNKEECVRKFRKKYQNDLEEREQAYEIKDYITDLLGIRIICLYEDQVERVSEALNEHFEIIDVTDKISAMESTEDAFGYKGLHMDLAISERMRNLPKYKPYVDFPVEVQIRTLIQDAWSVLDHQIKYKKSIPNDLKRRINALSALFELADREFKEIRNATQELIQQATEAATTEPTEDAEIAPARYSIGPGEKSLNAFSFLRVAGHYFRDFEFEGPKVDDFVQDIIKLDNRFLKSHLHQCLASHLKTVQKYRDYFLAKNPNRTFSPYMSIRHCLHLCDPETFDQILYQRAKLQFKNWLGLG